MPMLAKPELVKPELVKPEATMPELVKPEAVKPVATESEAAKSMAGKPRAAEPLAVTEMSKLGPTTGIRPAGGAAATDPAPVPPPVTPVDGPPRPVLFRTGERVPSGGESFAPRLDPDAVIDVDVPRDRDEMASTKKMMRRRRRAALVAFVGIAAAVLLVGQIVRRDDSVPVTTIAPAATALPPANALGEPSATDTADVTDAAEGAPAGSAGTSASAEARAATAAGLPPADTSNGRPTANSGTASAFTFVSGYGPVLGTAGTLRRFKVAVERTLGQGNGGDFADEIDRTLGDSRSWVGSGQVRLQRVPAAAAAEFTIYLASPRTSTRMCAAGGLSTRGFTSCRLPGQLMINSDRWQDAVPDYDASLATYRAYAINHEVGHQLGHGHELCPGKGRPAPVMQQQTYGLKGCVANAWPYIDGKLYAGEPTA